MASRTKPRRSHAERSQATQQHLIATAIEVVQTRSFEGTSIFEVARSAGMTPGAVQHHFESKAVLMMAVLRQLVTADDHVGGLWPQPAAPLQERAEHFVQAAWQLIYAQPRFIAAWNIYLGTRTQPEINAQVAQERQAINARMHEGFLQAFPELADAPDRHGFIAMVFSTLRGIGLLGLFGPAEEGSEAQRASLVDTIVRRCRND